jgi:uncharacterized membrane protein YccC
MKPLADAMLPARLRAALRVALSHYVTVGLSAAIGLLLISTLVHLALGAFAASAASVGVIVVIPPDQAAPQRGKFWQLLPAALIGPPLFLAVQVLHADPWRLGLLLVPAAFVAFLGAAWGKRGLPIAVSIMFAMIFSMALPTLEPGETPMAATLYFTLGVGSYLVWATLANSALNARYRSLMLADTLLAMSALMRTQARLFVPDAATGPAASAAAASAATGPAAGQLLHVHAALADQLQAARDIVLEAPRTPRRQRLSAMLIGVLDLRDHLVACELDLDTLQSQPAQWPVLRALRVQLEAQAGQIEALADALLLGRLVPVPGEAAWPSTAALSAAATPEPGDTLARSLVARVGHIHDEVARMTALATGRTDPDLAVVRDAWQMFTSPTAWSWRPFFALWRWDAPPLRHAVRAALAIAAGQAVGVALPWGTHDYWILLTIVVVLRGSLAQTLERRNSRVAGTLMGCLIAAGLLALRTPPVVLLLAVTLAQAIAHAFAARRYLVTAVAATVLALLQAHLLNAGVSVGFEAVERIGDTLIGVALAWAFSYVLPSWERTQVPALVARTLAAQARHAEMALKLGQVPAVDEAAELGWRLARREVYDSLSALAQAVQRSLSEPRAVRPPLPPLERLLAHSWQLLAQLTAVKSMLLLRRARLDTAAIRAPLEQAAAALSATLLAKAPAAPSAPHGGPGPRAFADEDESSGPVVLPDPMQSDLSPWLLHRLHLARGIAQRLRDDAAKVLTPAPGA